MEYEYDLLIGNPVVVKQDLQKVQKEGWEPIGTPSLTSGNGSVSCVWGVRKKIETETFAPPLEERESVFYYYVARSL